MSKYLQQEFEFITRTKLIINQYKSLAGADKYEITLLINCFVGLLIPPQQYWFDDLPDVILSKKDWGISPDDITLINKDEIKNVKNVSRHLRNSISHYKFTAFSDDKKEISHIKFEDFIDKIQTFDAIIPVGDIEHFVNAFSDYMLNKMEQSK